MLHADFAGGQIPKTGSFPTMRHSLGAQPIDSAISPVVLRVGCKNACLPGRDQVKGNLVQASSRHDAPRMATSGKKGLVAMTTLQPLPNAIWRASWLPLPASHSLAQRF